MFVKMKKHGKKFKGVDSKGVKHTCPSWSMFKYIKGKGEGKNGK